MRPTCETCRFYDTSRGICRLRPPVPVPVPMQEAVQTWVRVETAWPEVTTDDWCGEHEPVPAPERADVT